jgi:hypothetical protein
MKMCSLMVRVMSSQRYKKFYFFCFCDFTICVRRVYVILNFIGILQDKAIKDGKFDEALLKFMSI